MNHIQSSPRRPADRGEVIRVKLLSLEPDRIWLRQLPSACGAAPQWGRCRFLLDRDETEYDWLLVCNDLPGSRGHGSRNGMEPLCCAAEHTMLVTTEPSSIKTYGSGYTRQFACVLTSQEPWALPHRDRIYGQAANRWFYGIGSNREVPFDQLIAAVPPNKTATISMVWSGKKQRHTWHYRRHRFMEHLRSAMPELEVYGRGIRELDDKAQTIDSYRYTIAIENHIAVHHWTEKLADPLLGYCLPFYYGCPNAAEYFPSESFIAIDIDDLDAAERTIREAIREGAYERRLPAITEARRRVLEQYNFFAVAAKEIEARFDRSRGAGRDRTILSRRMLRRRHPLLGVHHLYEKLRHRMYHRSAQRSGGGDSARSTRLRGEQQ